MLFNLIKSEIYRATKMKCTYILMGVLVALTLLSSLIILRVDFLGAYGIDMEQLQAMIDSEEEMDAYMQAFDAGIAMGTDIAADPENSSPWGKGLMYYEDIPTLFLQTVTSLNSLIVLAIFIGIYLGDVYNLALEKNLTLTGNKRSLVFAARTVVIAGYTLISHIVAYLSTILSAALMADSVKLNIDKSAVLYFIITLFITFVFSMLVTTVCMVTRSKVAGIVVGILMSTGLVTNMLNVVDYIVKRQFNLDSDFSIGNYTLITNLTDITLHTEGKVILRALVCAVIYLVLFIITDIMCSRKRDIA